MHLYEIHMAISAGVPVYWKSEAYQVMRTDRNHFYIHCNINDDVVGLCDVHGNLKEHPNDFYTPNLEAIQAKYNDHVDDIKKLYQFTLVTNGDIKAGVEAATEHFKVDFNELLGKEIINHIYFAAATTIQKERSIANE